VTPAPARLEYGDGFDLAAGWLGRVASPLLVVASTSGFVDLAAGRAEGPLVLACENARTSDHAALCLAGGDLPRDVAAWSRVWSPLEATGSERDVPLFDAALWASPQPGTWPDRLVAIDRLMNDGGRLCILTGAGGGFAGLTRRLRARRQPGEPAPLAPCIREGLAAAGWRVSRARSLGGLVSTGWAAAGRLAALAGRPDLADRAERAHHLALESEGETGAAYVVLLAEREGAPAAAPEEAPGSAGGMRW
jgi:hypothetical protein